DWSSDVGEKSSPERRDPEKADRTSRKETGPAQKTGGWSPHGEGAHRRPAHSAGRSPGPDTRIRSLPDGRGRRVAGGRLPGGARPKLLPAGGMDPGPRRFGRAPYGGRPTSGQRRLRGRLPMARGSVRALRDRK